MSIEEKIKTAKEDSWLKDSVSEKEFKEIKDNERRMTNEETFCWCDGCKEYDTENRCCHRYSSFIRYSLQENINAVLEDIKAEIEKEQAECPYPLDIEHAIDIIEKHISGKEE